MRKLFILYDGRAKSGDPDEASVMDTARTEGEARKSSKTNWRDYDVIWYEYDEVTATEAIVQKHPGTKLGQLIFLNENPRWDL